MIILPHQFNVDGLLENLNGRTESAIPVEEGVVVLSNLYHRERYCSFLAQLIKSSIVAIFQRHKYGHFKPQLIESSTVPIFQDINHYEYWRKNQYGVTLLLLFPLMWILW